VKSLLPFALLLFFVSWFAPAAHADSTSMSCGGPTLSDGAFLASWCGNNLFVAGPNGIENLELGFIPDVQRSFSINAFGEFVGSLEFAGDRSSYFLIYTGAGTLGPFDTIPSSTGPTSNPTTFPPGAQVTGDFGTFTTDAGPIIDGEPPTDIGAYPSVLITGLSDQGVVTGVESYYYSDSRTFINIPVAYYLPALGVPEPGSLLLIACGLAFLLFSRSRFRYLRGA